MSSKPRYPKAGLVALIERVRQGESVRALCREPSAPSRAQFFWRIQRDEELNTLYRAARRRRYE